MTFAAGASVLVKDDWPEARGPAHVRTPHYLRGKPGRVLRRLGVFANPEDLAFARPAVAVPLYHVVFEGADVWPEARGGDLLLAEVFEHWLDSRP